ncbi:chemotaxis protein [Clostridium botulinum]
MYKVLVFGTGNFSEYIKEVFSDEVYILAYVDNDKSKWYSIKNGRKIIPPKEIQNYYYDYIVIASQYNEEIYTQLLSMNIDIEKIFQCSKFLDNYWDYNKAYIDLFSSKPDGFYEVLVTGISYTALGLNPNIWNKRTLKFAFGSQDLFYDYHTIKYLIKNYKNKMCNIKHVIIGLCYYSFQYDMSLSAMKGKTVMYYEVLKNAHHFHEIKRVYEEYEINKRIGNKFLRKNRNGSFDINWKSRELIDFKNKERLGKKQAELDCNKNYPKTVEENKIILKEYLKLLKDNNIKPIVVVFPASKYYTKYFSKRIEDEFHSIIKEIKEEHDFQYIDHFRSDLFNDDDFKDVSHLNWHNGAKKFTKILNEEIQW